jgi:hypothetical protein
MRRSDAGRGNLIGGLKGESAFLDVRSGSGVEVQGSDDPDRIDIVVFEQGAYRG